MMDEVGMEQIMLLEFTHFGMKATCIRSLVFQAFRADSHDLCWSFTGTLLLGVDVAEQRFAC